MKKNAVKDLADYKLLFMRVHGREPIIEVRGAWLKVEGVVTCRTKQLPEMAKNIRALNKLEGE